MADPYDARTPKKGRMLRWMSKAFGGASSSPGGGGDGEAPEADEAELAGGAQGAVQASHSQPGRRAVPSNAKVFGLGAAQGCERVDR